MLDYETLEKVYGLTAEDIQKMNSYTNQSALKNDLLKEDYAHKHWFNDSEHRLPKRYSEIQKASLDKGFAINSDIRTGSLLRTLAASKAKGNFLEIGTGCGLGTSWLLEGMDQNSTLTSIESQTNWFSIAHKHLSGDHRLTLLHARAEEYLLTAPYASLDFIFADATPGKYFLVDETIALLKPGGFYVLDDCIHQETWPEEVYLFHRKLINLLENRQDVFLAKMNWAVGIIIAVKKS